MSQDLRREGAMKHQELQECTVRLAVDRLRAAADALAPVFPFSANRLRDVATLMALAADADAVPKGVFVAAAEALVGGVG